MGSNCRKISKNCRKISKKCRETWKHCEEVKKKRTKDKSSAKWGGIPVVLEGFLSLTLKVIPPLLSCRIIVTSSLIQRKHLLIRFIKKDGTWRVGVSNPGGQ